MSTVLFPCIIQLPDGKYIKTRPENIQRDTSGKLIFETTNLINKAYRTIDISHAEAIKNNLEKDFRCFIKLIENN